MVLVGVDPVGSILALPEHLNDEGRLSSYKVCAGAVLPRRFVEDVVCVRECICCCDMM